MGAVERPRRVRLLHDRLGTLADYTPGAVEVTAAVEGGAVGELLGQWSTVDGFVCDSVFRLRVASPYGLVDVPVMDDEIEEVSGDDR